MSAGHPCKLGADNLPCGDTAKCRFCYLFAHDQEYRTAWGGDQSASVADDALRSKWSPSPPPLAQRAWTFAKALARHVLAGCPQASERDRRLAICRACEHCDAAKDQCRQCGCRMGVKAAWELERCPLGKWDVPVLNLLYHVLPIKGNGTWQRNLDQLRQRLPLFNGKKVIAVVHEASCDHPAAVQEYLGADGIDWVVKANRNDLREVGTWHDLWERIDGRPGMTFYGHAKGVTHPVNPGVSIHRWVQMLYHTGLDYLPLVGEVLEKHPIAGSFKKVGAGFGGSRSSWHYSGAFYWVRTDAGLANYKKIDPLWFGVESWPGVAFRPEEGGCLFMEGRVPGLNLYHLRYLQRVVEPEFEQWRAMNRKYLSVTGSQTA